MLSSVSAFACSCYEEPMPPTTAAIDMLVSDDYAEISKESILDVQDVKHHTTVLESLEYRIDGPNSCNGKDQNGDVWVMCMPRYVDTVKVDFKNCSIKMKVVTKITKAKAKVTSSTCGDIRKGRKFSIKY